MKAEQIKELFAQFEATASEYEVNMKMLLKIKVSCC